MNHQKVHFKLSQYPYEFLLFALLLLIFDKVFFPNQDIYLRYVWPFNMVIISAASFGIFIERDKRIKLIRNALGAISILMPFAYLLFNASSWFMQILIFFFIFYYVFIFWEVMSQITKFKEVRLNVIIGSFCGFMLLCMLATFSYLAIELNFPKSFHGITYGNTSTIYNEIVYFSMITLTSIGFGDIHPLTDMARLVTAFFGMVGQFYMVAVVGITVSRFTSNAD